MKNKEHQLLWYAAALVCVMYLSFAISRLCNNKVIAYFGPYTLYLMLLLIGYMGFKRHGKEIHKLQLKNRYIYYIAAFIPLLATFIVAFIPTISQIPAWMLVVTILYSIVNGTLEELFWRDTFNRVYGNEIVFAYMIPTVLFTCWHFSLLLCKGMSYHGGAAALVGGAGFMGILWGYVMFRTKNIKITIAAHVLVNICAFSQLLYCNF